MVWHGRREEEEEEEDRARQHEVRGGGGEPHQRDERKIAPPGSVTWVVVFHDQRWTDQALSPNLVSDPSFDELCACSYIHRRGISNMCAKETKGQEDKEERG